MDGGPDTGGVACALNAGVCSHKTTIDGRREERKVKRKTTAGFVQRNQRPATLTLRDFETLLEMG